MKHKLAIVDDHILIANALKSIILNFEEFEVIHISENGVDFQEKLKSKPLLPDVVLLDISMPIMDGFKATKKIRAIEKSTDTHTPIIAVTANAFPEDKERCIASGMDDYISKPFQPDELITKIKHHLS